MEEATVSNMWELGAVEMLEQKGFCTKQDLYDIITEFPRRNPRATIPETVFPKPVLLTDTEDKIIDDILELLNHNGLTSAQSTDRVSSWAESSRWASGYRRGRRTNKEAAMGSRLAKRLLCAGLASLLPLVLHLLGPLVVTESSAGQATDAVTVTSVYQDKGLVIVRDHGPGATKQIKIENVEALKSFKVGEVLEKPAGLEVQPRALQQSPPTMSGKSGPGGSCVERCMASPGTTFNQCVYWCATR